MDKEREREREREREYSDRDREKEIERDRVLIPRSGVSRNDLNRISNLTILWCRRRSPSDFSNKFLTNLLKGIIHSHRDLNSVSSSTDKTNLLGPIPSRLQTGTVVKLQS
jgi:hypothetical protein